MASDFELLERWRGGDSAAGNELFGRHFSSVCRFFETKVAEHDVSELVQRAFEACVKSRDRFRGDSSFRTYLFTIARHELCHHFRRQRRGGKAVDIDQTSVADLGTTIRSKLARNAQHAVLLQALRLLPIQDQMLLELFYWEGLKVADLVQIFEISDAGLRTRLSRSRKVLRSTMSKLEGDGAVIGDTSDFDSWARGVRDQWPNRDTSDE